MKPGITMLTLAVDDLERALRFYRDGLGLPTEGVVGQDIENGTVAFFDLAHGLKLALFPRAALARDAGLPAPREPASHEAATFSLGHNVRSQAEVDATMIEALQAGATLVRAAHKTAWGGYSGYFRDPDGHLWEVVHNPQLLPDY